uniref:DUF4758 domain-containing protein n=1 Tax=Dendroctonus ponderosae TaxID=77166 RepID=A0AAR5PMV1_DENPD
MERTAIFMICCIGTISLAFPAEDIKLVNQPTPGQEFVFVHSSESGAKPIARKEKEEEHHRKFETAHKIPPNLTFALSEEADESEILPIKPVKSVGKKVHKRYAAEPPAPAPPGAIKLNVAQLLEKYKEAMKTSTVAPSSTTTTSTTKTSRRRGTKKRSRRSPSSEVSGPTTQRPVLTTSRIAPKNVDFDVVGSASDKQRSRIQIKKGPNGQEYEYEYVYYYYDDDEGAKDKVTNGHDGPARNSISRNNKSREKATPEVNEVLPSRSKPRGRQLDEDSVQEERLPTNTRSRNLNTTPAIEEDRKPSASRTRSRGRPAAETSTSAAEEDNVSDETQGSRGRTRANVRRPSLELVDSETFNTHSASQPAAAQSPTFPAQLPGGPVRFLGATPNEFYDLPDEQADKAESTKQPSASVSENDDEAASQDESETTTPVTGMKKVALDLYAISQGTQKLFGEEGSELSTEEDKDYATTQDSSSTEEIETTTPTTTTTTTTTTTPAPTTTRTTTTTTTTTTEAPTKASRFGGRRTVISGRKSTTTTEAPAETESKPKKFGRPSFGGRARGKPTPAPAPVEEDVHKEESKPVSQSKPPGRARFGAARPRGRTTAAPEEAKDEVSTSAPSTANHKPSLPRSRPTFNALRGRGRSTSSAPPTEETVADSESSSSEPSSTTARPPRRIAGGNANIKPLRPGPRINIGGRRTTQTTTTTTESSSISEEDHAVSGDEEEAPVEAASEKEEAPASVPVDNTPLGRLRNKNRLNIQPKAKSASAASASSTVQVRRINPLLNRRKPGQTTEAPASEAPSSEAPEPEEEPAAETEPSTSSSSTTEEPRGLNKLLAGRRRLAARVPGTINHK